ncbi:hypothetical protein B0E45_32415 [Sinorhizobium sp. A49]|uniref:hypothetical protein n=1 Tax=Sinorhizobium sp. A49 TaxID=1945861 RepID=UPI000985AAA3|nr:hypothetical protein [Sinorhizobium sp. A49]OOG61837.1 hypothetical protein B0E45_32415 [Sinorhizobium sp. A49]
MSMPERSRASRQLARFHVAQDFSRLLLRCRDGGALFAVGFLAYTNVTDAVDLFATILFYFALFLMLVHSPMVFRTHVPISIA